ncbi:pyrroloquinoline quinone biosynthesis protein PqqE, partial [Pseudomonas aeruginosa]|nr:pyrroloquinoline quinone biosynthesis protein PqqE [Pseudomonas aeruginosa]
RGDAWMPEPCRSCEEKERDHGGCRCQAFLLTGDADATDPVCAKSARHDLILAARRQAEEAPLGLDALTWRNQRASRLICKA